MEPVTWGALALSRHLHYGKGWAVLPGTLCLLCVDSLEDDTGTIKEYCK